MIDLRKAEMAAGSTFVAISRLKRLQDGLFQPMTYERLKAIGQTKRLLQRKQEESHHHLSQLTMSCHHRSLCIIHLQRACTHTRRARRPPACTYVVRMRKLPAHVLSRSRCRCDIAVRIRPGFSSLDCF